MERAGGAETLHADASAVRRGRRPVGEVPPDDAALVMCAATGKPHTFGGAKDRRSAQCHGRPRIARARARRCP
ncbi:hypothetical protein ACOBQB_03880 [Streptomyces sp. G5(2025)]|uniref:hypothetical protein n=1 Tax=Streptomyces sp. G5(2025) TaxID=3406628 RepID=UPI003C201450